MRVPEGKQERESELKRASRKGEREKQRKGWVGVLEKQFEFLTSYSLVITSTPSASSRVAASDGQPHMNGVT